MWWLQKFIIVIAIFFIFRTWIAYHRKKSQLKPTIAWSALWVAAIFVILFPWTTDAIARYIGSGSGANWVVYLSIIGLFYLGFKFYIMIEEIRKDETLIVREIALMKKNLEDLNNGRCSQREMEGANNPPETENL